MENVSSISDSLLLAVDRYAGGTRTPRKIWLPYDIKNVVKAINRGDIAALEMIADFTSPLAHGEDSSTYSIQTSKLLCAVAEIDGITEVQVTSETVLDETTRTIARIRPVGANQ